MANYIIILAILSAKTENNQNDKLNFLRQNVFYKARYLIFGFKIHHGYSVKYTLLAHSTFNLHAVKKMGY